MIVSDNKLIIYRVGISGKSTNVRILIGESEFHLKGTNAD